MEPVRADVVTYLPWLLSVITIWMTVLTGNKHPSAWEPTPAELAVLVAGGHVVLSVVGGQPPVSLDVEITTEKEAYR